MFRQDPGVPLVVPEVNADHLASHTGIIATPNCSTIQMVVALKPIYDAAGIERVVVSTYQAVSGSGQGGIAALAAQAGQWAAGEPVEQQFYPHQIAFNVLPHIDSFLPTGSTKEEQRWSTRPPRSSPTRTSRSRPPACACPSSARTARP